MSVLYDGRAALSDVDLRVAPGEAVALVGPSGAGQTTALSLCNAMVRPTKGSVTVDGEDLSQISERELRSKRSHIGFIPQDLGLVPNLRVSQNVLSGRLGEQGIFQALLPLMNSKSPEHERVLTILDKLGIGEKLFHRVDSLSGGERQRVAIARALYQDSRYLLADEPLSALDPARARETIALLVEIARENDLTLLLSMHDIELAREFVPRLVGLRAGRVLFDGAAGEISEEDLSALYTLEEEDRVG